MSVEKLIRGLQTKEEILQAVAPDPTPRDLAVWEAATLFSRGKWKPEVNPDATTLGEVVNLSDDESKDLRKRVVAAMMDMEGTEATAAKVIATMIGVCKSPEELAFCFMLHSEYSAQSGESLFE